MEVIHVFAKLFFVQEETIETNEFPVLSPEDRLERENTLPPTPNNPPWNSGAAFGVWVASIFFIFALQTLFVGIYILQNRDKFNDFGNLAEALKNNVGVNIYAIISVIPAHILTLLLCWLVVTNFRKFSFKQTLGWRFEKFKIWYIFVLTGLFLAGAAGLTTYFGETDNELLRILRSSQYIVYLVAFMATFTAPLVEEVVYRGVMYSAFQRTFNPPTAVILVTFLFAIIHVPQYYPDFVAIGVICVLSLTLTLIRAYTNNLLPCIALHFVFNGVQSLFLVLQPFVEKQLENPQTKAAFILYFFN